MTHDELRQLIALYVSGEIGLEQHTMLEHELKNNPDSRTLFRELIDLEIGLSEWSRESASQIEMPEAARSPDDKVQLGRQSDLETEKAGQTSSTNAKKTAFGLVALAATLLVAALTTWAIFNSNPEDTTTQAQGQKAIANETEALGTIRQSNCVWKTSSGESQNRADKIKVGKYELVSGVAQLWFDSGSHLTLQGPCELIVDSIASATLMNGSIVVNVSELSDGFLLATPESSIVDLGTEYGVTINETSTEVHVFDGSVVWQPNGSEQEDFTTIAIGEASRFQREAPKVGRRVTFGQRNFVRNLEAEVQRNAKGDLIAFDGFENVAGKLRRGRSGFGWNGGWHPPGRRKKMGQVIDAPGDEVFGVKRKGQKLLELQGDTALLRALQSPILVGDGEENSSELFVSFVLERIEDNATEVSRGSDDSFFKFGLISPESSGRRHGSDNSQSQISFGVTSQSTPFAKSGMRVADAAVKLRDTPMLFVAQISKNGQDQFQVRVRIYEKGESRDAFVPKHWTVTLSNATSTSLSNLTHVRLESGKNGCWQIDHLCIGKSWASVTSPN